LKNLRRRKKNKLNETRTNTPYEWTLEKSSNWFIVNIQHNIQENLPGFPSQKQHTRKPEMHAFVYLCYLHPTLFDTFQDKYFGYLCVWGGRDW
jgi:hypothetical protein